MPCRCPKRPLTRRSRSASTPARSERLFPFLLRRKAIDQRQPIEAFLKAPGEIILPALRMKAAPLTDLLHGHSVDQHIVHQSRSVGAELAFDAVQPQHGLALSLGDGLS